MGSIGSGYVQCKCRDCFEITLASDVRIGAFCAECVEARCEEDQECKRPDAYCGEEAFPC